MTNPKALSAEQQKELLSTLQTRFEKNRHRHEALVWADIQTQLENKPNKLWSLHEMEQTGGEPDVVGYDKATSEYLFYDCCEESPKGRRSYCYDHEALEARKEHKPKHSAQGMAKEMGVNLLTIEEYQTLQQLGNFDNKTSSWLATPAEIRKRGGAIFGDFRYNQVFIYHNGAESYYAARGFRASLRV